MKKLKIGLITFFRTENYGGMLQAYATKAFLSKLGHEVRFLDWESYAKKSDNTRRILKNPKVSFKKFLQNKVLRRINIIGHQQSAKKIRVFQEEHLKTLESDPTFLNGSELDLMICGSDQIWNFNRGANQVFFGVCPVRSKRKVSYAASFGSLDSAKNHVFELSRLLDNLDDISVREADAVEFLREVTKRTTHLHADPTFLNVSYNEILGENFADKTNTLFIHVLRDCSGFQGVSDLITKKLGLRALSGFNPQKRWREIGEPIVGGPVEWLTSLSRSKFSLNNSFHATVFSILFNVPFIVLKLTGNRAEYNSRSYNLLEELGLAERMVEGTDLAKIEMLVEKPIDWVAVNQKVATMRKKGSDYLKEQLAFLGA